MAQQPTVALAQIKIKGAGEYVTILSLQIDTQSNQHGSMIVTLRLETDEIKPEEKDWTGAQIQAETKEGILLFTGECIRYDVKRLAAYREVTLYIVSNSYQADITENSRTFQKPSKTMGDVAKEVLEPYGAIVIIQKDKTISEILVQDKETDWNFLIRVANQYGYQLYTDPASTVLEVALGSIGSCEGGLGSNAQLLTEQKDLQEMRLKAANQGEEAGTYRYSSENLISYNLRGTAGSTVEGKKITNSHVVSEKGVLVNYVSTVCENTDMPGSESMLSETLKSRVLTGTVLAVNESAIKVKFDIDEEQAEEAAMELPYENTMSNSFYCMPEVDDKVYGYIDNQGTAIILGSKRKDTEDAFYGKPEEKAITALDNMIQFQSNCLELTANREQADKQQESRVTISLDNNKGIDIHGSGKIDVYSLKTIGIMAGTRIQEAKNILENYEEQRKKGTNKYKEDGGSELAGLTGWDETKKQIGKSFGSFFDTLTAKEIRHDIQALMSKSECETIHESFDEGTISIEGEQIELKVGNSSIKLGMGGETSSIYINADVFHWLGFEKKTGYETVEQVYSDAFTTYLDIVPLVLDIAGTITYCVCPPAGLAIMGVNAAFSLCKGDYCGALLSCIPFAQEAEIGAKLVKAVPKLENAVKAFGVSCKVIDEATSKMTVGTQFYSVGKKACSGELTVKDLGMLMLNIADVAIGKKTDGSRRSKGEDGSTGTNPDGTSSTPDNTGNHTGGEDGTSSKKADADDTKTTSDIDAENIETSTEGGDPVDLVTGALTERRTDLRLKDINGDYRVVRTYRSTRENKGRMLGSRWMFQFEVSLHRRGSHISIYLPDAHKEQFIKTEEGWQNQIPEKEKYHLIEMDNSYQLEDKETRTHYQFDKAGHIQSIEDKHKNKIRYHYEGELLTSITVASGLSLYMTYTDSKLTMLKDSQEREYHYSYEGEFLTAVSYPNGGTIRYEYSREGHLTHIYNEMGKCYATNQYDRKGRVVRQVTADGEEYLFFYDDANKINTLTTVGLNQTVKYRYNQRKLVEEILYEDGTGEEKKYDANEKVVWEKDRLRRETHRSYDSTGNLLEETKPSGLTTAYEYDEAGNCIYQEDNAGRKIRYRYDESDSLISAAFQIEEGIWAETRYERDRYGRIQKQIYPDGSEKRWSYKHPFAHPTTYIGAEQQEFHYELDEYGRKMICSGARGDIYYGYNSNHFLTMVRDEEKNHTRYQYDLTGNRISIQKPEDVEADDGRKTSFYYDHMDHLVQIEDANGTIHARQVNSEGKIIKQINPSTYNRIENDGEGTGYTYDENGYLTHVRYADGGILRRYYDACGNLIKQIEPEDYNESTDNGRGMTYGYDEMNRLVSVTNAEGEIIRVITYDLAGRVVKDQNQKELELQNDIGKTYRYNHAGWLKEARVPVTEENGEIKYRLTHYEYDIRGNLITEKRYLDYQTETSAGGRILRINRSYDKSRRLIKVTDSLGACQEYKYDSYNKLTAERRKIREGVYYEKKYSYTKSGRLSTVAVSADENTTGRRYAETNYYYNRNGEVRRVLTPTGHEIRREYDRTGKLIKEEHLQKDGAIHVIKEYAYEKGGRLSETRYQGGSRHYEYDCRGRRTLVRDGSGNTMATIYDKNNRLVKLIHPRQFRKSGYAGQGSRYTYADGRLQAVYRIDGSIEREYCYNKYGEPEQIRKGNGEGVNITYDLAGRRTHIITANGAEQSNTYDAWGNITSVTDGNGNTTGFTHDEWGKITEVLRADGGVETYEYDIAGNMTEATDGNGHSIRFRYNNQNRLEARIDQVGEMEIWNYDAEGRPCRYTDRNGTQTAYQYNMYGNLTRRWNVGVEGNENTAVSESYGYTPEGRLSYAIGGGMRYDYVYDEAGHLMEKQASGRTLLSYEYNQDNQLSARTDYTGKRTEYRYNEMGQLEEIIDNGVSQAVYDYTPEGRIRHMTSGYLESGYQYDTDGNMTALQTLLGDDLLVDNQYQYDRNGNCIEKATLSGTTSYTYDSMNRLTEAVYPWGREVLGYDYADNRISREFFEKTGYNKEQLSSRETYQYDERNRLIRSIEETGEMPETNPFGVDDRNDNAFSMNGQGQDIASFSQDNLFDNGASVKLQDYQRTVIDYIYDKQGNLLKDGNAEYTYDLFNRLEKAETFTGDVQKNRYDAEGLRHEMEENGKLVQFLYHGKEVVAEKASEGNVIRYIRGYQLISSDNEKAKVYYHYASDELGSITHIVKGAVKRALYKLEYGMQIGSGENHTGITSGENGRRSNIDTKNRKPVSETDFRVLNHYEYDAFGNTIQFEETIENRFRFAGEQYDPITRQYYLRARFYNPVIGRFIQEDNYYGDGLNLYAYCKNNPVSYVDPSGHGTVSAADKEAIKKNADDLKDYIKQLNDEGGVTPEEATVLKELAEEFDLDPNELDIQKKKDANPNKSSKASDAESQSVPTDKSVIKEFADEYGMDADSLGANDELVFPLDLQFFASKKDKTKMDADGGESGSNTVTVGENNQSIVYRVIRSDENPMNGLTAKNPTRGMSIEGHIVSGSRNKGSQFISTTTDINVANKYALQDGCRIVEIDLNKLPSNVNIYDLSTAAGRNTYLKGVTAKNFAAKSSEVLLEGYIPSDAINLR